MLLDVVEQEHGTAHVIKSDKLLLAGKTGTAQLSAGASGYKSAGARHQVSFCGYFPADKPVYSCIVVIRNPRNGYPSGGGMSGMVFKNIAEKTYALGRNIPVDVVADTSTIFAPKVKNGNYKDLLYVLNKLDIKCKDTGKEWEWTTARIENNEINLSENPNSENLTPSVYGMGAKDAVFILENKGFKVQINGKGKVYQQSRSAGQRYNKGETIVLNLR